MAARQPRNTTRSPRRVKGAANNSAATRSSSACSAATRLISTDPVAAMSKNSFGWT